MTSFLNKVLSRLISSRVKEVDYNEVHAYRAAKYLHKMHGKDVLVVGCSTGKDCRYFVEMGASRVVGVDPDDRIGSEYQHERVKYHKISVEDMDILSGSFDLVYCFATMEHVQRIDLGFSEMVRVAKPNGIIYSMAAPLWNSRNGHHMGTFFNNYPWIHLRLTEPEILEYCRREGIADTKGVPMETYVSYMLDSKYFNKEPSSKYKEVCRSMGGVKILHNDIELDDSNELTPDIFSELEPMGYTRKELLAAHHLFIAKKLGY